MDSKVDDLEALANPLVTAEQLSTTSSRLDGISADLESSLRYAGAQLTQAAGILLRLPQEIIVQAIVTFYRYYVGAEGGSFRVNPLKDISAASIYLIAKLSFLPVSPRSVLNVYAYLTSPSSILHAIDPVGINPDPESYYLSEGSYQTGKNTLFQSETIVLRSLAFTTRVVTPHHLALTYLQTLGLLPPRPTERSKALASRTLAYLNTATLSPQLLYLTHQPSSLAVSAIYIAAREVGVPIARGEWWEVFDVDREELGFLSVGLLSTEEWVRGEDEKRRGKGWPMTIEELEIEMHR